MPKACKNSRFILRRPGSRVKGRIYAAGIHRLGDLARAAGVSVQTLTNHLAGIRRNPQTQDRIVQAFWTLTNLEIPTAEFWGSLFKGYRRPKGPRGPGGRDDRDAA